MLIILITLTAGVAVAAIRGMMHGVKTLQDSSNPTNLQPYSVYTTPPTCYYSDNGKDNPSPSLSGAEIRNH